MTDAAKHAFRLALQWRKYSEYHVCPATDYIEELWPKSQWAYLCCANSYDHSMLGSGSRRGFCSFSKNQNFIWSWYILRLLLHAWCAFIKRDLYALKTLLQHFAHKYFKAIRDVKVGTLLWLERKQIVWHCSTSKLCKTPKTFQINWECCKFQE